MLLLNFILGNECACVCVSAKKPMCMRAHTHSLRGGVTCISVGLGISTGCCVSFNLMATAQYFQSSKTFSALFYLLMLTLWKKDMNDYIYSN